MRKTGDSLRELIYGMEEENLEDYMKDMKTLLNHMVDSTGHSKKYKKLYHTVKAAAEIHKKLDKTQNPKKTRGNYPCC